MTSRSLRTVVAISAIGLFGSPVLLWVLWPSGGGSSSFVAVPADSTAAPAGAACARRLQAARVVTGASHDVGVWLTHPVEGSERGACLATIIARQDGAFDLGELAPGRYRLRPFRIAAFAIGHEGIDGEPIGQPVDIEVAADGKVTPAVVWPDGVK